MCVLVLDCFTNSYLCKTIGSWMYVCVCAFEHMRVCTCLCVWRERETETGPGRDWRSAAPAAACLPSVSCRRCQPAAARRRFFFVAPSADCLPSVIFTHTCHLWYVYTGTHKHAHTHIYTRIDKHWHTRTYTYMHAKTCTHQSNVVLTCPFCNCPIWGFKFIIICCCCICPPFCWLCSIWGPPTDPDCPYPLVTGPGPPIIRPWDCMEMLYLRYALSQSVSVHMCKQEQIIAVCQDKSRSL